MSAEIIVSYLYRELIITGLILLLILRHNNIVIYKLKLKDALSVMLIAGIVLSISELVWDVSSGRPELRYISYIAAFLFIESAMIAAMTFNRFFLSRFDLEPKSRWLKAVIYLIPNVILLFLTAGSPWTKLMFTVDSEGVIQEGVLFDICLTLPGIAYGVSVLIFAVYNAVREGLSETSHSKTAKDLVIFALLNIGIYGIQMVILGEVSDKYMSVTLGFSVALIYLITTVNTRTLVDNQTQIEAAETDMRIAAKIQEDALPHVAPEFVDHPECLIRASMNTAREVGGDFYDYFTIDDKRLCLVIADVSGKGTPAALFMMTVKTMIKDYALICRDTAETFIKVNQRLCEQNEEGMFATAWIGIFDTETKVLQYTNAGHNYLLIIHKNSPSEEIHKVHGLFLAGMEDTHYKSGEINMEPGDRLLLYTDGITEAHSMAGEIYGMERLRNVFDASYDESGETVLDRITESVNIFADGEPQFDDMTMILLTVK